MKRTALKADPEKVRAFQQRGRESSAESLRRSGRGSARKSPPRRRPISPASPAQRAKVAGLPCLACGRVQTEWLAIDAAHVVDRSIGGCDSPDCVVPLCRTFDGNGCHDLYDRHELDLLPLLEHEARWRVEQAHAVLHLGIARAYRRTTTERSLVGALPETMKASGS